MVKKKSNERVLKSYTSMSTSIAAREKSTSPVRNKMPGAKPALLGPMSSD